MHVLIAGCGWLGEAIGRRLVAEGHRVTGVRRDPARAAALSAAGIAPLALDLTSPGAERQLPEVDAVVACQSARDDSAEAYRAAYVEATRVLLAAGRGRPFVYTGSTGVFGQGGGVDVDESTPPAPSGASGAALVEAERLVTAASAAGARATMVVRLSGLYGPGRAGIVERVRSGALALGRADGAWMNFCHRDDAATFVLAALARGRPGAIYHGSDAAPARRRGVVEWIAARAGFSPPRSDRAAAGPDRRVLSGRTRAELGVALRYPSFREGLAELI